MRKLRSLILLIILFQLSALIASPPDDGEVLAHFASPDSGGIAASIASEEENIDSFDVNPKSGRWNVTNDNSTDDLVTDSILRMTTINNLTSNDITDPVGYEMNRGTTKTDGKIEYRMAASGGGNQSEYFRDVVGDKVDFEEGDVEGFKDTTAGGVSIHTVSDGVLNIEAQANCVYIDTNSSVLDLSANIVKRVVYRIKSTDPEMYIANFYLRDSTGTYNPIFALAGVINGDLTGEWQTFDYDLTEWGDWIGAHWSGLLIYFDETDGTVDAGDSILIEYIEFIGDLDYATHIENEIEDTWDWEDSNEYWYTEEGNVSDFNDGTTEGYESYMDAELSIDDGWIVIEDNSGVGGIDTGTGESITAATYYWLTMEAYSNVTITGILIYDSDDNEVLIDWDDVAADTYHLYNLDLTDADWTGIEVGYYIVFRSEGDVPFNIQLNMTYLYDVELGDIEGFSHGTRADYNYVNPEGHLVAKARSGQPYVTFFTPDSLSLSFDNFDYFKLKIRSFSVISSVKMYYYSGGWSDEIGSINPIQGIWNEWEIDFSEEESLDKGDIITQFAFDWDDESGNTEGDEYLEVDYDLLLGHWDDSESVIGLFDQDNLVSLLNVSTVFTSDNNHSITSDKAYFTVELLDLDGDVAYSAISANYTDISDLWIQAKITFDVLRSKLSVTINADNLTRIDKWTFPADFTEESGRIPALFSHEKNPYIFVSTFSVATSWQEIRLDYIKADYSERTWIHTDIPTDADWTDDLYDASFAQDDIDDDSQYYLNIPYLDSYTAILEINYTSPYYDNTEHSTIGSGIYNVDADDGDLHQVLGASLTVGNDGADYVTGAITKDGASYWNFGTYYQITQPRLHVIISLHEDRSVANLKARFWVDKTDENNYEDFFSDVDVSNCSTVPSQEFSIRMYHRHKFDADMEASTLANGIGIAERDRLAGFPQSLHHSSTSESNNWLAQLFIDMGRFLAAGIGLIMDPLFLALGLLVSAVTTAVNQIQGWLTTLGSTIGTAINQIQGWLTTIAATISSAIDQIQGWLNTIATTISEAVAAIAADIWTAFGTAASGIMDDIITALTGLAADVAAFIDSLIQFLIPLLLAIASDLADLLVGIIDQLLLIGGDIVLGIITFIAGVVFFFWEALGLPDVLAILDMMLTPIFETITGIPQAILDFIAFFTPLFIVLVALYWFWLIFLAFAQEGFDPFAGLAESFGRLFTTLDFSILGFGPIPFPIALFFIPLTYFLILPPESMFAIW